jgi:hypothetical protein
VFHVMVDDAVLETHSTILKSRAPLFSQFAAMEVKKVKYVGPGSYGAVYKGTVCRQEVRRPPLRLRPNPNPSPNPNPNPNPNPRRAVPTAPTLASH